MRQAFEDQIKDELQHDCLSDVLNDVKALPLCYTLAAFNDGKIPNINLTFKLGNIPTIGQTMGRGGNQTVTLNYDKLSKATDLFVATAIIHESIHAYMNMYLSVVRPEWFQNTIVNGAVPNAAEEYKILRNYLLIGTMGIFIIFVALI